MQALLQAAGESGGAGCHANLVEEVVPQQYHERHGCRMLLPQRLQMLADVRDASSRNQRSALQHSERVLLELVAMMHCTAAQSAPNCDAVL